MKMFICTTTRACAKFEPDWIGIFCSITPKDPISHWITKRLTKCIMASSRRGAAPTTPAKGFSPSAHPGGWQQKRDFVPRTLAKGQASLQTPVFSVTENAGSKETTRLTKSTGKIV